MARPRIKVELEPVSTRLKTALVHPAKTDLTSMVQFSPDGKRIVARSYPSDVVQVWDVQSGKQLTAIETKAGKWAELLVSTDWSTLYVSHYNSKTSQVEREGKRLFQFDYDSEIEAWDLATAKRTGTFRFTPSRGISDYCLSPNGRTIATFEYRSGEYEGRPPRTASLWDVKTRQFRPLPEGLDGGSFSADGKTLVASLLDDDEHLVAFKLFDVATATEKQSLPAPRESVYAGAATLSPDGRLLAANLLTVKAREYVLKLWDTATAEELMTFRPEGTDRLSSLVFSPDGTQLVVSTFNSEPIKLFLFDLGKRTLSRTVSLGPKAFSFRPTFSPDGRWIVVVTQVCPEGVRRTNIDPLDTPQARIHVIDSASGTECETLIAPQGLVSEPVFHPDGTLLATGSTGKVLLWDFRQTPAPAQQSRR